MTLIITVLHVMAALALIGVVLLQRGSGNDMGAAFGGSSQSVFGARGGGSFMGKLTAGVATIFMLTSLTLSIFTTQQSASVSVMDEVKQEQQAPEATPVPAKENKKTIPTEGGAKPVPVQ
uniref:Protein-export membrane protein SecG n=1 Tax=Magnetococcus massalia (strain MO-1) TaxID=451514 RepID=A0A1S7LGI0_MAGMO|nr:preprotein translocase membrane subunit [Candidatus Magnetococcus massalia]